MVVTKNCKRMERNNPRTKRNFLLPKGSKKIALLPKMRLVLKREHAFIFN